MLNTLFAEGTDFKEICNSSTQTLTGNGDVVGSLSWIHRRDKLEKKNALQTLNDMHEKTFRSNNNRINMTLKYKVILNL